MPHGTSVVWTGVILSGCAFSHDEKTCDEHCMVSVFGGISGFLWGSATAAAQIEGAWNVSGKQPSIWDDFCHSIPHRDTTNAATFSKTCGKLPEGQRGSKWTTLDVTDDFFHKHREDLDLLKGYGMNAMRVSISWPRLMPYNNESKRHEISKAGIDFYKTVFAEMKQRDIIPFVTLFHWDLPNDLSWLEDSVVDAFVEYASVAFDAFPEIRNWATFNEPNSVCSPGYNIGSFAPGHKSTTDHLLCGHNILKAHAKAVQAFRKKRLANDSQIGIILDYKWAYPKTDTDEDWKAAQYDRDNVVGFWAEPIFLSGDYPASLKEFFGTSLPAFTEAEKTMLKGSADFYGANSYGGAIAEWSPKDLADYKDGDDIVGRYSFSPCHPGVDNSSIVDPAFECGAASDWLWAKPDAMRKYLEFVHAEYKIEKVYVTEFGVDVKGESDMRIEQALNDSYRQAYYERYMEQIALAKKESKVPIQGVFAWSLLDNFEWADGLNFRFGITYVDFSDLSRYPKNSAKWWTALISRMKAKYSELVVMM